MASETSSGIREIRREIENKNAELLIAYSDLQRNLSLCRVAESIMASLDGMQRKPRKFVCDFYDDPDNYLTANYTLYKITQKNNNVVVNKEFASGEIPLSVFNFIDYDDIIDSFGESSTSGLIIIETKKIHAWITRIKQHMMSDEEE